MSNLHEEGGAVVRVLTLNLWQEQGPWRERLELCKLRIASLDVDVLCLQEVRDAGDRVPNQAFELAEALGMATCVYHAAQQWGGGDEGIAVLARLPERSSAYGELASQDGRSRRICVGAELDVHGRSLWVFSTHLAFRLEDGALREQQVAGVDAFVTEQRGDAVGVVCGDFNAPPDSDEMRFMRGLTSIDGRRCYYQDAFAVCNGDAPGLTWSQDNAYTELMGWHPDRRLDYIYVSAEQPSGSARVEACSVELTEPDHSGVLCSDHYAVMAEVCV